MESEIELNKLLNNAMSNQAHWYSCGKILFLPWDNYAVNTMFIVLVWIYCQVYYYWHPMSRLCHVTYVSLNKEILKKHYNNFDFIIKPG